MDKDQDKPFHTWDQEQSSSSSQRGLIYLSRIPHGMGPAKVKHILSQYGEIDRVYLAPYENDHRSKRSTYHFKEGWVEFLDKKVARRVAGMLNANRVGGKNASRWSDEVWTMKYLPKFRWDHLSEQMVMERKKKQEMLRVHLSQAKKEQEAYMESRIQSKAREAKRERLHKKGREAAVPEKTFSQREVVQSQRPSEDLSNVISKIF